MRAQVSWMRGFITGVLVLGATIVATSGVGSGATSNAQGVAFADSLLRAAPLPSSARLTTSPSIRLTDEFAGMALNDLVDVHLDYVVSGPFNLATFIKAHRPSTAAITGPSSSSGSTVPDETGYEYSLALTNQHVSFETIDYTVGDPTATGVDLRVDAQVVWTALDRVRLPAAGRVTLTGYGTTSLVRGSSDPVSVTLSASAFARLATVVASLSNSTGGVCMEDEALFTITASAHGTTIWSAIADACPGVLRFVIGTRHVLLDDRSCALRSLVAALLPAGARATRASVAGCQSAR